MIVCQATGGDKVVLILGLSHANLGKLKEGQPIKITRESHGLMIPAELAIVISAAEVRSTMTGDRKRNKGGIIAPGARAMCQGNY